MKTTHVEGTVLSLHKERLRRERKTALRQDKTAKGVEKVADEVNVDPILTNYPDMLAFGATMAVSFDIADAKAVLAGWSASIRAAEAKEIAVSDADIARWYEHQAFAEAFLRLLYLCNGYDEHGDPPISAYVGVMNP